MIIEKFKRMHKIISCENTPKETIPNVALQIPSDPTIARFYSMLLYNLGAPITMKCKVADLEHVALKLLKHLSTRMIIIDELHNILASSINVQREFLNLIRFIGNELQIPIFCLGIREAYLAIRTDDQLENRFEPHILPLWEDDREFSSLLISITSALALKAPSFLLQKEIRQYILRKTESTIGEIISLLSRTAILAIESGQENIDLKLLMQADYDSPTERRNKFERRVAIMAKRFPIWPHPYKLETLISWIMRIADYYRIDVDTLFEIGFLIKKPISWWDIDVSPSPKLLNRISINTGLSLKYLIEMTIARISPWVIFPIKPIYDFEFTQLTAPFCILNSNLPYINRNSNSQKPFLHWMPNVPWKSTRINLFCPICIENKDLDFPRLLVWRTTLVSSCLRHNCLLVETRDKHLDQLTWKENIINTKLLHTWLDGITLKAIETGFTRLGKEEIHVNIWVRFLRSLFYEITIKIRDFKDHKCIKSIWQYAGIQKPKSKAFELLEMKEKANVMKCAAYLLQDFPDKLISFINKHINLYKNESVNLLKKLTICNDEQTFLIYKIGYQQIQNNNSHYIER